MYFNFVELPECSKNLKEKITLSCKNRTCVRQGRGSYCLARYILPTWSRRKLQAKFLLPLISRIIFYICTASYPNVNKDNFRIDFFICAPHAYMCVCVYACCYICMCSSPLMFRSFLSINITPCTDFIHYNFHSFLFH